MTSSPDYSCCWSSNAAVIVVDGNQHSLDDFHRHATINSIKYQDELQNSARSLDSSSKRPQYNLSLESSACWIPPESPACSTSYRPAPLHHHQHQDHAHNPAIIAFEEDDDDDDDNNNGDGDGDGDIINNSQELESTTILTEDDGTALDSNTTQEGRTTSPKTTNRTTTKSIVPSIPTPRNFCSTSSSVSSSSSCSNFSELKKRCDYWPASPKRKARPPIINYFPRDELDLSREQKQVWRCFYHQNTLDSFEPPAWIDPEPKEEEDPTSFHSKIQFGTVCIRECPRTVGDNPSTTRGVPLTLEWDFQQEYSLPLVDFESVRPFPRRTSEQMQTQSFDRMRMLKAAGWSAAELKSYYVEESLQTQSLRNRKKISWEYQWEEWTERILRSIRNATIRRNQKRDQRKWLQHQLSQK